MIRLHLSRSRAAFAAAFCLFSFNLFLCDAGAEGGQSVQAQIAGASVKNLAKAFISVSDIEGIKDDNIQKMRAMGDREFRSKYARLYEILKQMPADFKAAYGINENMGRREFIKVIKPWNKDKIYAVTESVPNEVIAGQLKGYLDRRGQEIKKGSLPEQARRFWRRVMYYISEDWQ